MVVENRLYKEASDSYQTSRHCQNLSPHCPFFLKVFEYANTTLDDLRKSRIEDARKTVKTRLVLEKIMVKEKLDITDEDIVNKFSEHAPDKKTVTIEDVRKTMGEEQFNYFANSLLLSKLMTFLKSKNKLD